MGYVLLFVEALGLSLMLAATLLACAARVQREGLRRLASLAVLLVPLGLYITLTGLLAYYQFVEPVTDRWFLPLALSTAGYCAGGLWLFRRRRTAASWSRGRLATASGIAAILTLMTFWNLDLAIRQQLALLRTKVSALALSAAPAEVPDRHNAALLYERAFELMERPGEGTSLEDAWSDRWDEWLQSRSDDFDPDDPELELFLESQTPAIETLLDASEQPDCSFGHNYYWPHFDMLLPELMSLRRASKVLALEARRRAAEGDPRGALQCVDATFTVADHISREPILICLLVGIALDELAVTTLSAIVSSHPMSEDDLAVVELDETLSYDRRFQRALRMEEAFGISVLCDGASTGAGDVMQRIGVSGVFPIAALYRVFLLGQDVAVYRWLLGELQQLAAEPFHRAREKWDALTETWESRPRGLLARILIPSLTRCAEQVALGDARRRLAGVLVDVQRYRAQEQRLPRSLQDLVPGIARSVPVDPFDGRPLRLARRDGQLVAYSIGPDGQDDGGAPFDSADRPGDLTVPVARLEEGG